MQNMKHKRFEFTARALSRPAWLALSAGLLTSCSSGPDFRQPDPPRVGVYTTTALPSTIAASPGPLGNGQRIINTDTPAAWWREIGSTKLNGLIEQALGASPTLAAAQATLRQAEQSHAALAGSTELPQVNASLGGQRQGINAAGMGLPGGERTFNLYQASVGVSHDLDLSGGNRRALESLAAQVDYQTIQLEDARLALAANVVQGAITQARLTAQIEASEDIVRAQAEQLEITRARLRLGAASENEVLAQRTQLEQSRAGIPTLRKQRQQTRHLLAVLAGQAPGAAELPDFVLTDFVLPADLPLSVPSELVRRRPDIRGAEALLHAASAKYGVAVAQRYPQLNLSASLGSQALTSAGLFGSGSLIWGLGGQLAQPLFNPGLRANAEAAKAGLEAAEAQYRQTVLQALRNVADVLRDLENDAVTQQSLVAADASAEASLRLMQRQHTLGAASYLQLLLAQQQAQQTRIGVIALQAQRLTNTVAFYQAMGGGWSRDALVDVTAAPRS
jgi:NodT family efflux transporter outer membrane factor (OMF) lipoprotein